MQSKHSSSPKTQRKTESPAMAEAFLKSFWLSWHHPHPVHNRVISIATYPSSLTVLRLRRVFVSSDQITRGGKGRLSVDFALRKGPEGWSNRNGTKEMCLGWVGWLTWCWFTATLELIKIAKLPWQGLVLCYRNTVRSYGMVSVCSRFPLGDFICILISNSFSSTTTHTTTRTLLNIFYYPLQGAHTAVCNLK